MMITQELECQENISQDVIFPPSDLYSDEPTVETELHLEQIMLLIKSHIPHPQLSHPKETDVVST